MVPIIGTKHQYNQLFYNKNQERLNSNAPKYAPPHNYAFIVKYQGLYMQPTITMYLSQLKIRKIHITLIKIYDNIYLNNSEIYKDTISDG